jgi:large subunit ribosomal protein L5
MKKNTTRLEERYKKEVLKKLSEVFNIKNSMAVPKVEKVVVNSGIGGITKDKEIMKATQRDLAVITGQLPSIQKAKISVASFNLRKGMPVGLKVTLRGRRMYDFLDRLFSIVLPRLRDFRGLSGESFDARGNYTLGIQEHVVFPEVDSSKVAKPFGLEITIVTNSKNIEQSKKLLELLGMPFEKKD